MKLTFRILAVSAAFLITAIYANAVTVTASNGSQGTFSVASTDLGQAPGTTLTLDLGTADAGSAVNKLNDGLIYGPGRYDFSNESFTPSAGAVVTFHFDLSLRPAGYGISSIVSLTGFPGRTRQVFDVAYSLVGNAAFTPLASVPYNGLTNNIEAGEVQVSITDIGLSGVDDLRFTFHDGSQGVVVYREIDITAVPEASTYGFYGVLALIGILYRFDMKGLRRLSRFGNHD